MPERVVDYTALTAPVAASEVAAFRRQAKADGMSWALTTPTTIVTVVLGAVVLVVFVFIFGGGVLSSIASAGSDGSPVAGAALTLPLIGLIAAVAIVAHRALGGGGRWKRWLRLTRFAAANGLGFSPMQRDPNYPGQIFQLGRDHQSLDHLTTRAGRFLDIGNFRWTTGSGKSQTTHTWGFLALALDRAMPNIVLDSKANNGLFGSNLPVTLARNQVLHLEGDFDRYFTLYCPAEYEQDALYIFTPDLMALLIDTAAPFDVELVDRWLFAYSTTPFDTTDPATLQRLFTIADTVGAKAVDQTEHYADDRIGDPAADIVAPQGARLRHGVSVVGIVIAAVFVAIWGWTVLSPILGALGR